MEPLMIEMKEAASWLDGKIDELLMQEPAKCRAEDIIKIFEDCYWLRTVFERG